MMNLDKATPDLFAALARAQSEIENATKNSNNPHFKSKYADLAEVLNAVRPVFAKNGVAIIQSTSFDGRTVVVVTALAHLTGGIITSDASCVPAKTDAQGVGAATTYLRRYALSAMAGIAQEDDDGNGAAHDGKPQPPKEDMVAKKSAGQEKAVSSAEQKRQLEAVSQDLVDAHSEADVKRLIDIWASIAERDGWSRDYWGEAMRRFKRRRADIRANAENQFPGNDEFPGSDDFSNHPINAG